MKRCPTCNQPIERKSGRVCFLCGRQIARHDKFFFEDGRVRHRVCDKPTEYTPEAKAQEAPPLVAQAEVQP